MLAVGTTDTALMKKRVPFSVFVFVLTCRAKQSHKKARHALALDKVLQHVSKVRRPVTLCQNEPARASSREKKERDFIEKIETKIDV